MPLATPRLRPIAAAAAVVVLAGCGGAAQPHLRRSDAAPLIRLAQRIAHEGSCAQVRDIPRLQQAAIRLVDSRRVPPSLQEPLVSGVNALVATRPLCVPPAPPVTAPAPPLVPFRPHGPPGPPGHDHGHGHGPHHGDGGDG